MEREFTNSIKKMRKEHTNGLGPRSFHGSSPLEVLPLLKVLSVFRVVGDSSASELL